MFNMFKYEIEVINMSLVHQSENRDMPHEESNYRLELEVGMTP